MRLFAIESSCDESALALFVEGEGITFEQVHSQVEQHVPFGGVVPDLASREHLRNFGVMVASLHDSVPRPDRIAVTTQPGLPGCLALGEALACGLALRWGCPLEAVDHVEAHVTSVFLPMYQESPDSFADSWRALLPHLGLVVSGGNTVLYRVESVTAWERVAATVDDAAGEALDKGAKLLGLPYPGGPQIEVRARRGNPDTFAFPRAFAESREPKFSFAGLKTSLRYQLEKMSDAEVVARMDDLCASYEEAVAGALATQTARALKGGGFRSLGVSGGVANNARVQARLQRVADRAGIPLLAPRRKHTGDNAAMIAFLAWLRLRAAELGEDARVA